ncbi:helix-turn-helix transcriptional regulator [Novosphingobium sp.]|uniref:helix-turn-helix transcriptional regulator n=1 Tax=Novosphingobium sp. TaxID=1874826 RepID=UPI0025DE2CC1|nr:helix-turn-helix transcriptional regulator [Novosphingobium sp.]
MTDQGNTAKALPQLTAKQRDVLALVADNRTSKEIAGLLGISESAVNQRIEIVRARLGGLPRGELARLYRQEFSIGEPDSEPTWQKIHLPGTAAMANGGGAEGISPVGSSDAGGGDGSQLSAFFFRSPATWLNSDSRAMVWARVSAMAAIFAAALAVAVLVTQYLAAGIGGG